MATNDTLARVKLDLRVTHTALDQDIKDTIDACLQDLRICGIPTPDETDPIILNAIKLYTRANFTDDTGKGSAYMERYGALKSTLMMASGYRED